MFTRIFVISASLAVTVGAVWGFVRGLDHLATLWAAVIEGAVLIGLPGAVAAGRGRRPARRDPRALPPHGPPTRLGLYRARGSVTHTAISTREWESSLARMLSTCPSTVRGETDSRAAIIRFVSPVEMSPAISISRAVSGFAPGAAAGDGAALGASNA